MKPLLTTLLLGRVTSLSAWESELPEGVVNDRLDHARDLFVNALSEYRGTLRPDVLGRFRGSFLATFPSPCDALSCAHEIRHRTCVLSQNSPTQRLSWGIAINAGEVLIRRTLIVGRPLDVVSRLAHRADHDEILFTEVVLLLANDLSMTYRPAPRSVGAETGPAMRCYVLDQLEERESDGEP